MKKFPIPVYDGTLYFFNDYKEFTRHHKKVNGEHIDSEYGITCEVDGSRDIMVGVFDGSVQTLVHEIVHAAMYVFQRCEIDPAISNHEPYAYFVDCLYGLLTPHLDHKGRAPKIAPATPGGADPADPIPF